jgi:hypothetical protein
MKDKVWVVVTVDNNGEYDVYADVIGVFTTMDAANEVAEMLRHRENPVGIDIDKLATFEGVAVLELPLDETIHN